MIYKMEWSSGQAPHLQILDDNKELLEDIPQALTSAEACRKLKKSRRQLYRFIQRGWLTPAAHFSGEYFFKPETVLALRGKPRTKSLAIPPSFALLFPEYEIAALHGERDAGLVLARILERGGRREIAWALKHYSPAVRKRFLEGDGRRLLSKRAHHFWSWLWHVPEKRMDDDWRNKGLPYGGVA